MSKARVATEWLMVCSGCHISLLDIHYSIGGLNHRLYSPFINVLLHLPGDVDERPSGGDIKPEFFAITFHWQLLMFAVVKKRTVRMAGEVPNRPIGE